jgi:hypothetical protein
MLPWRGAPVSASEVTTSSRHGVGASEGVEASIFVASWAA